MASTPKTDVREAAKAATGSLPENSKWQDVFYGLYVQRKIETGLKDVEKRRSVDE